MKRNVVASCLLGVMVALGLLAVPLLTAAQQPGEADIARQMQSLAWQRGPTDGNIGGVATIKVAEGLSSTTPFACSAGRA